MSHGPESHNSHEAEVEPERIPITDPRVRDHYRSIADDFTTTHRGPNGDFYQIKNTSGKEASNRLHSERIRNAKMSDALANELYRLNGSGAPIRPAKSGEDFLHNAVEAGSVMGDLGNYDIGSVKEYPDPEDPDKKIYKKGPLGGFISYGTAENGANEMAAISERSASVVLSNEARQKALEEGKTFEEAQAIGAQTYLEQERFRAEFKRGGTFFSQPEASSFIGKEKDTSDDSDSEKNKEKERFRSAKWLLKTGRKAAINFSVMKQIGVKKTAKYYTSKLGDTIEDSLTKAGDVIETTTEQAVEAIKTTSIQEAEQILRDVDAAVKQTVETYESTKNAIKDIPQQLAQEYKVATGQLGDDMQKVGNMWIEYRKRVKKEVAARVSAIRHYTDVPTPPAAATPST